MNTVAKDKNNNPLWESVYEYITHLQFERRLSSNTLYAYKHDLKIYTDILFKDLKIVLINTIKSHHIEKFVRSLNNISKSKKLVEIRKSSSIHRLFSTIRGFHQYFYQFYLF